MPRRPVLKPYVWPIPSFRHTVKALEFAAKLVDTNMPLSVISAAAGEGKTFAAEFFCQAHPRHARHCFCPPRNILTPMFLLEKVSLALGQEPVGHRVSMLYNAVAKILSERKYFLIMDEADRLRAADLDMMRDLSEEAGVAICFMGCPGLLTVLEYAAPTKHRVGYKFMMPRLTDADLHKVFDARFDTAVVDTLWDHTAGNLRHIEAVLGLIAKAENGSDSVQVTPDLVHAIAADCLLGAA